MSVVRKFTVSSPYRTLVPENLPFNLFSDVRTPHPLSRTLSKYLFLSIPLKRPRVFAASSRERRFSIRGKRRSRRFSRPVTVEFGIRDCHDLPDVEIVKYGAPSSITFLRRPRGATIKRRRFATDETIKRRFSLLALSRRITVVNFPRTFSRRARYRCRRFLNAPSNLRLVAVDHIRYPRSRPSIRDKIFRDKTIFKTPTASKSNRDRYVISSSRSVKSSAECC